MIFKYIFSKRAHFLSVIFKYLLFSCKLLQNLTEILQNRADLARSYRIVPVQILQDLTESYRSCKILNYRIVQILQDRTESYRSCKILQNHTDLARSYRIVQILQDLQSRTDLAGSYRIVQILQKSCRILQILQKSCKNLADFLGILGNLIDA